MTHILHINITLYIIIISAYHHFKLIN